MGMRFGRRAADGSYEYHDSKASLVEAERREASETRRGVFVLIGLVVGGFLTYALLKELGGLDWPKWLRMLLVLSGAGLAAFVLAILADVIWALLVLCMQAALMYCIGRLLWMVI
jgi:hypothetical protein